MGFEWQIDIMWDILENNKHSKGTDPLLVDLMDNQNWAIFGGNFRKF